ncbi:hypothetical protein BDV32DRAFT_125027 [Aspergillus pseudonomiae]|uniref:DRBM domain-containing protein n=1 Tax=Aspergillus nomiae NRRL (strain ATCC 15546 / NRRL 13137 / CBS 260.88 / M93) TaxID=1509407 RepID=A0A0L1IJU7_ASPN3|nr:uncharacterized protein ANOM_011833 [Aspergillus nomiae NRRL 13137]KAB8258864.1 hypothetical protein BDV32DRAFT_125027 [Aspergillus pseudonomiae]KNG79849.1 hypothetical protein ANOM_011833 [Aspergillus nomiae NRRL 13137]
MPVQPANNASAPRTTWQQQLEEHCEAHKRSKPLFRLFTERRGGRTAWTCIATIDGVQYPARFWYDGKYSDNAIEDAAEKALNILSPQTSRNTRYPGQIYP